jgi:hypothetical protein
VRAIVMIFAVVGSLLAVPAPAQAAEPDYIRSLEWQIGALALTDVHKKATGVDVVVAVVDSGVDTQHPDLTGQVGKGPDGANVDIDGRGTGMAGLIAGKGHGTEAGVLGVAPGAKILPIAYAPIPGEVGDAEKLASGIELAISRGAKIICIGRSSVANERLEFAIEVAADRDVLVVAVDNSAWPATYPGVFAAIPADRNGAVPKGPASGRSTSLAVPGIDLMTTDRGAGYRISDQSGAAAILAGAAAVVWSAYPSAKSHPDRRPAATDRRRQGRLQVTQPAGRIEQGHPLTGREPERRLERGRAAGEQEQRQTPASPYPTAPTRGAGSLSSPCWPSSVRWWSGRTSPGAAGSADAPARTWMRSPDRTPSCAAVPRVTCAHTSSPSACISTRTSKPRWTIRPTTASWLSRNGVRESSMSCGRTSRPPNRVTGPRKLITNGLAGFS